MGQPKRIDMGVVAPEGPAAPSPAPDAELREFAERAAAGEYDDRWYPNYPELRGKLLLGVVKTFLAFEVAAAVLVANVLRVGFQSTLGDWASLTFAAMFAISGAFVGGAGFRLTPYVITGGVLQYQRMPPLYRGTAALARCRSFLWLERTTIRRPSRRDVVDELGTVAGLEERNIQTTIVVLSRDGKKITVWPRSLASPEHFSQALRANGLVELPKRYETVTR